MSGVRDSYGFRRQRRDLVRRLGAEVRRLREDAALTMAATARAAGIDPSHLLRIERGEREPSLSTLLCLGDVLGADLAVRLYPTTGPRLHDRLQATMLESLLPLLSNRWIPSAETAVYRPARGVIDLVLVDQASPVVLATEVHSELRRVEQQLRWHGQKADSLASAELWRYLDHEPARQVSRLLLLRSTRATRELARRFHELLRSAYPAVTADAVRALATDDAPWPGAAIVWVRVEGGEARVLGGPPRGIGLGRPEAGPH